jgi:endonuclease/exonuclease/phosphatase family metal-dependent hydrolase
MRRALSLALLAALPLLGAHAGKDQYGDDLYARVVRWDFWGPLPTRPFFTGHYIQSKPGRVNLPRAAFDVLDPFDPRRSADHDHPLLYGSVMYQPLEPPAPADDPAVQAALAAARDHIKAQAHVHMSPSAVLSAATVYPLQATGDNGQSEMVIVQSQDGLDGMPFAFKSHVKFGINFFLTLDDEKFNLRHRVAVSYDREGFHNVFQHTFSALDASVAAQETDTALLEAEGEEQAAGPRILSYNVWNTNPSADVYGHFNRWNQYVKRIDHLVEVVKASQAGIIGFQEVRYDGAFGKPGNRAQVQHLAERLPGYQYVYQAAMSYLNTNNPLERIEEGPAVFSKFPIVSSDYLLLSRDPNDPNDSHQRLCLHAVIDYPQWGEIDVYVTHLSLSERSREQTKVEIWEYMKQGRGKTQVLLGDLNSEPQSLGIQFLRGEAELLGQKTDLTDAWLEKHEEAEPRSEDPTDRETKFTFPSDNPSKRIDFVLYRGEGEVKECEIIGQAPTEDTKHNPLNVGMLHPESPVYASDHRAVIVELA